MLKKIAFILALVCSIIAGKAQTHDVSFAPFLSGPTEIRAMVMQPDEKVIIAGDFIAIGNTPFEGGIARLNADGSMDNTFDIDSGANSIVFDLALQPDGKLIVAGQFTEFNGQSAEGLIRLNEDGSVDGSFNISPGTFTGSSFRKVVSQADGKVLAVGFIIGSNGFTEPGIIRLNEDGSLDTSFDVQLEGFPQAITLQPDGKILLGGTLTKINSVSTPRVVRLNTDGTIDETFVTNIGDGPDSDVFDFDFQSDGKIITVGRFSLFDGLAFSKVARLNANGTLDATFEDNIGFNSGNYIEAVEVLGDDKIIIAGNFQTPERRFMRLNSDGTRDMGFDPGEGFEGHEFAVTANGQHNGI